MEKGAISIFSTSSVNRITRFAPSGWHLPLKGKAMRYSANKDVRFIMLSQLLIHRSAVPLLSQEKANLCHSFGSWLVKIENFCSAKNCCRKHHISQAFPLRGRCHDEGVTDEVSLRKKIHNVYTAVNRRFSANIVLFWQKTNSNLKKPFLLNLSKNGFN